MKSKLLRVIIVAIAAMFLCSAANADEVDRRMELAGEIYHELITTPERSVPQKLLDDSKCIAIIPGVVKVAWFLGGRYGKGVISCRTDAGGWSPPVLLTLGGGSLGLQIGASSTDIALFFLTERGVRSMLKSKFKLGAEAGVAAGPIGRSVTASTDILLKSEIYSYARSRGLFGGFSVEGAWLAASNRDMRKYYGTSPKPEDVLFTPGSVLIPHSAWDFMRHLPGASKF